MIRMLFRLEKDNEQFVAADYPLIRIFDDERVLVQVNPAWSTIRQLTLMRRSEGKLVVGAYELP